MNSAYTEDLKLETKVFYNILFYNILIFIIRKLFHRNGMDLVDL